MQLEEFISRLDGPKKSGNDFIALCPAHEDRTPSLSVATGEGGRILIKCHAGCTTKDVVNAMGLDIGDLFADEARSTPLTRVNIATSSPSDPPPVDPPPHSKRPHCP